MENNVKIFITAETSKKEKIGRIMWRVDFCSPSYM
jgi:hypothetical protein